MKQLKLAQILQKQFEIIQMQNTVIENIFSKEKDIRNNIIQSIGQYDLYSLKLINNLDNFYKNAILRDKNIVKLNSGDWKYIEPEFETLGSNM